MKSANQNLTTWFPIDQFPIHQLLSSTGNNTHPEYKCLNMSHFKEWTRNVLQIQPDTRHHLLVFLVVTVGAFRFSPEPFSLHILVSNQFCFVCDLLFFRFYCVLNVELKWKRWSLISSVKSWGTQTFTYPSVFRYPQHQYELGEHLGVVPWSALILKRRFDFVIINNCLPTWTFSVLQINNLTLANNLWALPSATAPSP